MEELELLFESENLVAINKPHGLLVHRTPMARDAHRFAVQELRNQIGCHVFPVHRLDRKTSGVLMFCKSKEILDQYYALFRDRKIKKIYHAIVRGHTAPSQTIEYPLKNEKQVLQEALTQLRTLNSYELPVPFGKFDTSRYSRVELLPETGRMHQLRKHMAHIFHPIIGDRPHGCNKQNKLWKERWGMECMLLHAQSLSFQDPLTQKEIKIEAPYSPEMQYVLDIILK